MDDDCRPRWRDCWRDCWPRCAKVPASVVSCKRGYTSTLRGHPRIGRLCSRPFANSIARLAAWSHCVYVVLIVWPIRFTVPHEVASAAVLCAVLQGGWRAVIVFVNSCVTGSRAALPAALPLPPRCSPAARRKHGRLQDARPRVEFWQWKQSSALSIISNS